MQSSRPGRLTDAALDMRAECSSEGGGKMCADAQQMNTVTQQNALTCTMWEDVCDTDEDRRYLNVRLLLLSSSAFTWLGAFPCCLFFSFLFFPHSFFTLLLSLEGKMKRCADIHWYSKIYMMKAEKYYLKHPVSCTWPRTCCSGLPKKKRGKKKATKEEQLIRHNIFIVLNKLK